jgi:hypothetical protein
LRGEFVYFVRLNVANSAFQNGDVPNISLYQLNKSAMPSHCSRDKSTSAVLVLRLRPHTL